MLANKDIPIFVAGHKGLIGSAFLRRLKGDSYSNVTTRTHQELDLTNAPAVEDFFSRIQPKIVVLCAGRVGGIVENTKHPAEFITENLGIQLNVFRMAHKTGVERVLFFGSSCMYPRECSQPMKESYLLTGVPEPTSLPYAMAKLTGVQMCLAYNQQYGGQRFIAVIPNNAYGPHDNFDLNSSHVLSALIRRFHEAKISKQKKMVLWGTGKPRREFVYTDDVVDAGMFLLGCDQKLLLPMNIGVGQDCAIWELADIVADIVGYVGDIDFDSAKPDGAPCKLLDSSRLRALGWRPQTKFKDGIRKTYEWFVNEYGRGPT